MNSSVDEVEPNKGAELGASRDVQGQYDVRGIPIVEEKTFKQVA